MMSQWIQVAPLVSSLGAHLTDESVNHTPPCFDHVPCKETRVVSGFPYLHEQSATSPPWPHLGSTLGQCSLWTNASVRTRPLGIGCIPHDSLPLSPPNPIAFQGMGEGWFSGDHPNRIHNKAHIDTLYTLVENHWDRPG